MNSEQINHAAFQAAQIAADMNGAIWSDCDNRMFLVGEARKRLQPLAAAMGYTLTPIAAPVQEAAE